MPRLSLWLLAQGVARFVAGTAASPTVATIASVVLWLVAAAVNMWAGVYKVGYSFREELPIFFLIFLLPVAVAAFLTWKFL